MDKFTSGQWYTEAALSSDVHSVRYITADGKCIARVQITSGMDQDEAIANAVLMSKAPSMLKILDEVVQLLKEHKDFEQVNSKVNYLAKKAQEAADAARSLKNQRVAVVPDQRFELTGMVRNFGYRLLRRGMRYGVLDRLTWDIDEPSIEFYLLEDRNGRPFVGRGLFINRFYYTTLKTPIYINDFKQGLCLDACNPIFFSLSSNEMKEVMTTIDAEIDTFANQQEVEKWRMTWRITK